MSACDGRAMSPTDPKIYLALALTACSAPSSPPPMAAAAQVAGLPGTIALPGGDADGVGMDYLAYDPRTNTVWVPAGNSGAVDVVDAATGKLTRIDGFTTHEVERGGKKRIVGPSSATLGAPGTVLRRQSRRFVGVCRRRADADQRRVWNPRLEPRWDLVRGEHQRGVGDDAARQVDPDPRRRDPRAEGEDRPRRQARRLRAGPDPRPVLHELRGQGRHDQDRSRIASDRGDLEVELRRRRSSRHPARRGRRACWWWPAARRSRRSTSRTTARSSARSTPATVSTTSTIRPRRAGSTRAPRSPRPSRLAYLDPKRVDLERLERADEGRRAQRRRQHGGCGVPRAHSKGAELVVVAPRQLSRRGDASRR